MELQVYQNLNNFDLMNKVINALNNNLEKDKSQMNNYFKNINDDNIINNFVEDFENANHKFRNKIISHINRMFSLGKNKESIFSYIISFFKINNDQNKLEPK